MDRRRTSRDAGPDQGTLQVRSQAPPSLHSRPKARSTAKASPARSKPAARAGGWQVCIPQPAAPGLNFVSGDMLLGSAGRLRRP